jgi:hypothetical protein
VSHRAVLISSRLIFLAGLWACWCDVALLWDGAYQFCSSLVADKPFLYLSRFHSGVVWQPVIWLSHITDSMRVLKMAFGAPFCFAPLASVLLSWWIVRRQAPHLILWALFGSAIATLPGQIFMINDSIFQLHFWWPVFFATFLPVTRVQLVAIGLVSLFQLSHPIGVGICGMCAIAALAFARWGTAPGRAGVAPADPGVPPGSPNAGPTSIREQRPPLCDLPGGTPGRAGGTPALPGARRALLGWACWHAALAAGGIIKLVVWPDSYAAKEASLDRVWGALVWGVLPCGPGLLAAWTAAALFVWIRTQPGSQRARWWSRAALPLLALTGVTWVLWASSPMFWQGAINYRRWVFPMSMPFLLAAGWEIWHPARLDRQSARALQRQRDWAGLAIAGIFFLVLGLQSYGWARLWHRMSDQVARSPSAWIKDDDLAWTHLTPLDHWGIATQVIVAQGRQPRVLFQTPGDAQRARETPARFSLAPWNQFAPETLPYCWFDWSVALREARKAPPAEP